MTAPAPPLSPAQLEIGSTPAESGRLHDWLDGVLASPALPRRSAHAIRLCLEEAVMNVIMHGYTAGSPGMIGVRLWSAPPLAFALIWDTASPFDPTAAPAAPMPASPDAEGGRGLHLLRHYSRAQRYERQAGRNMLTIEFALDGAPGGASPD